MTLEIEFKGFRFRTDDYHYSPGDMGNYNRPPDPEELEINTLEVSDNYYYSGRSDYTWHPVPGPLISMFSEDDEFMDLMVKKQRQIIEDSHMEREIQKEEDRRDFYYEQGDCGIMDR